MTSPRIRAQGCRSKSPHARTKCSTPKSARKIPIEKSPPRNGKPRPHRPPNGHAPPPQFPMSGKNIVPKIIIHAIPASRSTPLIIQSVATIRRFRRTRPSLALYALAGAPPCPVATPTGLIAFPHLAQYCPPALIGAPHPSQNMVHPLPDDTLHPPISSTSPVRPNPPNLLSPSAYQMCARTQSFRVLSTQTPYTEIEPVG